VTRAIDLVVVGSGFGGSLMAMIARQLGLSVVLLEQGKHPRMAIGESTTPLSNLFLENLSKTYNLPRLAPLSKWGTWQQTYPHVACGLKRGFTFYHQDGGQLMVAASPNDRVADTHWFRADVDSFLVTEAQRLGVEYRDCARIDELEMGADAIKVGGEDFHFQARFLIDATGPRGFLHRRLHLKEIPMLATQSLYSHFTGVGRNGEEHDPYPAEGAAVHHIFDGGWAWVLRFNNGVTSAGVAVTDEVANELKLSEGEPAWERILDRLPRLKAQWANATACQPFHHVPRLSFRSATIAGHRWAMLPSAAGFVDPMLSTGFPLTLLGIERLAKVLSHDYKTEQYAKETEQDLLAANRLVSALYANLANFDAFTRLSMIYFVAVSFAETAHRLGRPELAPGFLLRNHPGFQNWSIERFNLGHFGDPARTNRYPVLAEDLLEARHKLGATREEILAMLSRTGFQQT
jgi:tetracycline 7-halogenase / FADH2 O2-dependent halogenase